MMAVQRLADRAVLILEQICLRLVPHTHTHTHKDTHSHAVLSVSTVVSLESVAVLHGGGGFPLKRPWTTVVVVCLYIEIWRCVFWWGEPQPRVFPCQGPPGAFWGL